MRVQFARKINAVREREAGSALSLCTSKEAWMSKLVQLSTIAFLGAAAFIGAATVTPTAAAAGQSGLTQELSAACRTVVTHTWRHGRRIVVRRKSCTPGYGSAYVRPYAYASCRYVTKTRWSNGRRVSVRTRVCG
jgi:hypothetical protein